MRANAINLKFAAKMYADFFNITSTNINFELESGLSCSSPDRPSSDQMDIIQGSGKVGDGYNGGAAHGGVGGGTVDISNQPIPGNSNNSLYWPTKAGSRGTYDSNTGQKYGGRGDGWIHLRLGNLPINDGKMSANGEDATSSAGGAGSGGSVLIELYKF
jgi:hypothetical protein